MGVIHEINRLVKSASEAKAQTAGVTNVILKRFGGKSNDLRAQWARDVARKPVKGLPDSNSQLPAPVKEKAAPETHQKDKKSDPVPEPAKLSKKADWRDMLGKAKGMMLSAKDMISSSGGDKEPKPEPVKEPTLFDDPQLKHFSDVIVPDIKKRYGDIGAKDFDDTYYKPGAFGTSVTLGNKIPWLQRLRGAGGLTREDPSGYRIDIPSKSWFSDKDRSLAILAHEFRHVQNKSLTPGANQRTQAEDDKLKAAYGIDRTAVNHFYTSMHPDLPRMAREEAAATNAEYQFKAMQNLWKSLGRAPTAEEYQKYLKDMSTIDLKELRGAFGTNLNAYDLAAQNKGKLDDLAKKKGFKDFDDMLNARYDLDKGFKDRFNAAVDSEKIFQDVKPRLNWSDEELESFRKALMEVARNGSAVSRRAYA